jgi:hypothetical protein
MFKLFIIFAICLFSCFSFLWSSEISENEQSAICRVDQLIKSNNKILVGLLDFIQNEQISYLSFINYSVKNKLNDSLSFEKTRNEFQAILDYFDEEVNLCIEAQNETCDIKTYRANMMFRFSLFQRMIFCYEDTSSQYLKYIAKTCNNLIDSRKNEMNEDEKQKEIQKSEKIYAQFINERKDSYNYIYALFIECFNLLDENVDILEKESEK